MAVVDGNGVKLLVELLRANETAVPSATFASFCQFSSKEMQKGPLKVSLVPPSLRDPQLAALAHYFFLVVRMLPKKFTVPEQSRRNSKS
jgi:hypothetical protein